MNEPTTTTRTAIPTRWNGDPTAAPGTKARGVAIMERGTKPSCGHCGAFSTHEPQPSTEAGSDTLRIICHQCGGATFFAYGIDTGTEARYAEIRHLADAMTQVAAGLDASRCAEHGLTYVPSLGRFMTRDDAKRYRDVLGAQLQALVASPVEEVKA